jgi:hypothetical protein
MMTPTIAVTAPAKIREFLNPKMELPAGLGLYAFQSLGMLRRCGIHFGSIQRLVRGGIYGP